MIRSLGLATAARGFVGAAILGIAAASPTQGPAPAPLTAADFKKLHAEVAPKSQDTWEKIPWHIDLFEARTLAFKAKKPVFLWAMNGHPLGCT
jgi:hypothetical protein